MSGFFDDHDSAVIPEAAAAPSKASFFDDHDSAPIPSEHPDWDRYKGLVGEEWGRSSINPKNVYNALTHVDIPVLGPMAKRLGQAIIPQKYEDQQDEEDARFAKENPGASFAGKMIGGAALPLNVPQMTAGAGAGALARAGVGVANAGLRAGAGTALSAADASARGEDPVEAAKNALMIGGGVEAVVGAAKALPWVAAKAANVFGGTREETLRKYLENRNRINTAGARSTEDTKDMVDAAVGKGLADRDELQGAADAAEGKLDAAYKTSQSDMKAVTPLDQAKGFSASLEGTKAKLGEMSKVADEALERSGATFKRKELLAQLDAVGRGQGRAIGEEKTAALASWQNLRNRIAEQYNKKLSARDLREALQQIRQDTSYNQGAGEFNGTLDKMRKDFTRQISAALKTSAPKYAEQMEAMAPIADALTDMNMHFGNDAKALGSLEALRNKSPRSQLVEDALRRDAAANGDETLVNSLSGMRKNQSLLDRIRNGEDLRSELHPEDWKALQEAHANAAMAEHVASGAPVNELQDDGSHVMSAPGVGFDRLGEKRTYGVAKNGARDNNTSFLDNKALEALGHTDGTDYRQMLDDKTVHDSFYKERPNGSRMAKVGGAIGGFIGHHFGNTEAGIMAGAGGGATVDKYGGQMVKGIADAAQNTMANPLVQAATGVAKQGVPAQFLPGVVNDNSGGTSKVKSMLQSQGGLEQLGRFAAPLTDAAKRGNQSLAVTHYMLSQQEPEYSKLMGAHP